MAANMGNRPPIDAKEQKLSNLLSERLYFEIPMFQRSYAWGVDEYSVFWDDILRAYNADGDHVHFLGPIVFARNSDRPSLSLLDGQQRMTTLMLLISAMKSAADDLPESEEAEDLQQDLKDALLVRVSTGSRHQRVIRLNANRQDRPVFEAFIKGDAVKLTHDSHKLLKKVSDYLSAQVRELINQPGTEPADALSRLWSRILYNFWYIHIVCEQEINPQIVFESLNAKGEDLSSADLIKNYLFMERDRAGGERAVIEADSLWSIMVSDLGRDGELSDYMRTYWNSRYSFVRLDELYAVLRHSISDRQGNVQDLLDSLRDEARVFAGFRSPTKGLWGSDATARMIGELKSLNIKVTRSVLMALWSRLSDAPHEFEEITRAVLNFMVRYSKVTERPSNVIEEPFSRWAISIRQGLKSPEEFHAYLIQESPTPEQFIESFKTLKIKSGPTARLLLSKINNAMLAVTDQEEIITNPESTTLEHIIPQTPNDYWQASLDAQGAALDDVVSRVGNLTLLVQSWNTAASNRQFSEKRDTAYLQSSLPLNQDLVRAHDVDPSGALLPLEKRELLDDFTLMDLTRRQARMAEIAEHIWTV